MKSQTRRRRLITRKDVFELFICLVLAGLFVLMSSGAAFGQGNVGINNPTPHSKSLLDLTSADKGLLTPRMTAAQRMAMFPLADATARGMLVYQSDGTQGFYYYDGTAWVMVQSGNAGWGLLGNASTTPANFVGTTDAQPLALRTNGTERLRIDASGNVGIGVNAPTRPFHLEGDFAGAGVGLVRNTNATGWSGIDFGSSPLGGLAFVGFNNSFQHGYVGTGTAHPFRIYSNAAARVTVAINGDVGIGTNSPTSRLHVVTAQAGAMGMNVQNTNAAGWSGTGYLSSTGTGNAAVGFDNTTQNGFLGTTTAHPVTFISNWTERMRIATNGNVGVGTAAPASKMHVSAGAAGYAPNAASALTVESATSVYQNILSASGETGILFGSSANPQNGGVVYNTGLANNGMEVRTGGNTARMVIASNGHTTIGDNITWPAMRLGVVNNTTSAGFGVLNQNAAGWSGMVASNANFTGYTILGFGNSAHARANTGFTGTSTAHPFSLLTNNVERMHIATNGNVGFNMVPVYNLDLHADAQAIARFNSDNAVNGTVIELKNSTAGAGTFGAINFNNGANTYAGQLAYHATDGMTLRSGSWERMRIAPNGNVGIGTTTPTSTLEVNGFTKLGNTAPAVKMLKLTGTTPAAQGGQADIAHGLTASKILAVDVLIESSPGVWEPDNYLNTNGYQINFMITGTAIKLWAVSGNSFSILSKPVKVLITYEA